MAAEAGEEVEEKGGRRKKEEEEGRKDRAGGRQQFVSWAPMAESGASSNRD